MPVAAVIRRIAQRSLREEAGLSLSELVAVLAIMSIVLAALVTALTTTITQNAQIQEQTTLQTEVRAAVDTMVRELRQAYTGDATSPILTATGTTLEFLSPDKSVPYHVRRIAYRLAGGKLDRAITTSTNTNGPPWTGHAWATFAGIPASSWGTQVGSVTNTTLFSYFDQTGAPLTGTITPSTVRRVVITVQLATKSSANRKYTYSSSASLRWTP